MEKIKLKTEFFFQNFKIDGEEDELERFIMNIMADDPRTLSLEQTRKFRNLKILVLWLQKEQKFGRYCFYGCYCLPEGSHNIAAGGYGKLRIKIFKFEFIV